MDFNFPRIDQPFRFWCQKVLPLVYDDSLSYYELLCKVVTYINKLRDDVVQVESIVIELNALYQQITTMINEYVPEAVDEVLDKWAKNGKLDEIIGSYINAHVPHYYATTSELIDDITENKLGYDLYEFIITGGYHTVNDGGGAMFIVTNIEYPWSIAYTENKWINICNKNGVVNPIMFGAYGNGIADDTEALQHCFDYCFKAEENHIYYNDLTVGSPKGKTYNITSSVDINFGNANMVGDCEINFNNSIIRAFTNPETPNSDEFLLYILKFEHTYSGVAAPLHGKTVLKNLVLDGNPKTFTVTDNYNNPHTFAVERAHTGLYVPSNSGGGATFENIRVFNTRRGILIGGGSNNELTVYNCLIRRTNKDNKVIDLVANYSGDKWEFDRWRTPTKEPTTEYRNYIAKWLTPLGDPESRSDKIDNNGKATIVKSRCVGIEVRANDCFIRGCVCVDCVVGIRAAGGDCNYSDCHVWNSSLVPQIYTSCCVLTGGGNKYSGLICDRFYIGVQLYQNTPCVFVNTLFTNQPQRGEWIEDGQGHVTFYDDNIYDSYCWYIGSNANTTEQNYASRSDGANIQCINTLVYGDRMTLKSTYNHYQDDEQVQDQFIQNKIIRRLNWCDLAQKTCINDTNTRGYNVFNYFKFKDNTNEPTLSNTNVIQYKTTGVTGDGQLSNIPADGFGRILICGGTLNNPTNLVIQNNTNSPIYTASIDGVSTTDINGVTIPDNALQSYYWLRLRGIWESSEIKLANTQSKDTAVNSVSGGNITKVNIDTCNFYINSNKTDSVTEANSAYKTTLYKGHRYLVKIKYKFKTLNFYNDSVKIPTSIYNDISSMDNLDKSLIRNQALAHLNSNYNNNYLENKKVTMCIDKGKPWFGRETELIGDNKWHNYYNIIEINGDDESALGKNDIRIYVSLKKYPNLLLVGNNNLTAPSVSTQNPIPFTSTIGNLSKFNINANATSSQLEDYSIHIGSTEIIDISEVARYYLESDAQFLKRIQNICDTSINEYTIPYTPTDKNNMRAISLPTKLEFGRNTLVPTSSDVYDIYSDYYVIRYDENGKPVYRGKSGPNEEGTSPSARTNSCLINMRKNMNGFLQYISNKQGADYPVVRILQTNNTIAKSDWYQEVDKDQTNGAYSNGILTADIKYGYNVYVIIRNKNYQYDNNTKEYNTASISEFNFNFDSELSPPICEFNNEYNNAGTLHYALAPIYKNGAVYFIKINSAGDFDEDNPSESYDFDKIPDLPTYLCRVEYY